MFADGSKLADHIMWYPIDVISAALEKLYLARDQIKNVIYETTGISDILRGLTDPNETLGAQQIKTQWGSLRVQRKQAEVARFARDLFRLKAEIFATEGSTDPTSHRECTKTELSSVAAQSAPLNSRTSFCLRLWRAIANSISFVRSSR